jgi:predicted nuclease of predicted toxin-antitoxin system
MIRLLVDEDFNNDILRGLRRRVPDLDAPRVQGIGLTGAGDEAVLAYAAAENRIVLTHDISTMVGHAY